MNGYTMTGMRIPYAMAERNQLPLKRLFLDLLPSRTPWLGGMIQIVIAVIMMLLGAFDTITNMLIFVIWTFYCMAFLAVFLLRKREPELHRPYKVPLYPVIPMIALLARHVCLAEYIIDTAPPCNHGYRGHNVRYSDLLLSKENIKNLMKHLLIRF